VAKQRLENPRALNKAFASALGGTEVRQPGLSGFLDSRFDRFLNQLFASTDIDLRDAAASLAGRPGFVWLQRRPATVDGLTVVEATQMTATLDPGTEWASRAGEIADVRSRGDVDGWFEVYSAVFGAGPRARDEWRHIHASLGPGCAALVWRRRSSTPRIKLRWPAASTVRSCRRPGPGGPCTRRRGYEEELELSLLLMR
jgi:hypothetical protein